MLIQHIGRPSKHELLIQSSLAHAGTGTAEFSTSPPSSHPLKVTAYLGDVIM